MRRRHSGDGRRRGNTVDLAPYQKPPDVVHGVVQTVAELMEILDAHPGRFTELGSPNYVMFLISRIFTHAMRYTGENCRFQGRFPDGCDFHMPWYDNLQGVVRAMDLGTHPMIAAGDPAQVTRWLSILAAENLRRIRCPTRDKQPMYKFLVLDRGELTVVKDLRRELMRRRDPSDIYMQVRVQTAAAACGAGANGEWGRAIIDLSYTEMQLSLSEPVLHCLRAL